VTNETMPALQAGEATVEEVFWGSDGACYARLLYRMDPPKEVVEAWRRLKAERWIRDLIEGAIVGATPSE
jgi:hypothetical protein